MGGAARPHRTFHGSPSDFPARDGGPAARLSLLTSFRNAERILDLANAVSEPVRTAPVPVDRLRPRPEAPVGTVRTAVFERVDDEDAWVAGRIAEQWSTSTDAADGGRPASPPGGHGGRRGRTA